MTTAVTLAMMKILLIYPPLETIPTSYGRRGNSYHGSIFVYGRIPPASIGNLHASLVLVMITESGGGGEEEEEEEEEE